VSVWVCGMVNSKVALGGFRIGPTIGVHGFSAWRPDCPVLKIRYQIPQLTHNSVYIRQKQVQSLWNIVRYC